MAAAEHEHRLGSILLDESPSVDTLLPPEEEPAQLRQAGDPHAHAQGGGLAAAGAESAIAGERVDVLAAQPAKQAMERQIELEVPQRHALHQPQPEAVAHGPILTPLIESTAMPFVTLEGIEGSGKSTQLRLLQESHGAALLLTQEPGGTPLGALIRETILDRRHATMTSTTELLLYFADRAQHVGETLRPALERGETVVSDRYVDSTLAYQGYGRGIPLDVIRSLAVIATGGLEPDLTVLLDLPVRLGLARVGRRGREDRLESEVGEFHERVCAGYHTLAQAEPERWLVLDASAAPAEIHRRIVEAGERRGLMPKLPYGLR